MIAIDSSSFVEYLAGVDAPDTREVHEALRRSQAVITPAVLSELLSHPKIKPETERQILAIPVLPLLDGYWERVGKTRRLLFQKKLKPKLADTLIAQSCIDHDIALITRDEDFKIFRQYAKLILIEF